MTGSLWGTGSSLLLHLGAGDRNACYSLYGYNSLVSLFVFNSALISILGFVFLLKLIF